MANDSVAGVKPNLLEIKSAGMSRNYFCVDCKCTTRNPRLYLEHRRDFHKELISIHKCDLCVYASRHSQKLSRHLRTVHRDVVQNMNVESMQNLNLDQSAEAIPTGFQPIPTGKNTRLSTCKLCGLNTVSKMVLMEHIRTQHTDVRIYECDQCDYTHYIRDRYNRHHRYHSMNQIQCKLCEFQTIYRWNLERHMRHHIDSMSLGFRCTKCNFTVSTKQSITAHEIAHHSGIPLVDNITTKSEPMPTKEEPNVAIQQESLKQENNENGNESIANDNHNDNNDNNDAAAVDDKPSDEVDDKPSEEEDNFDANAFLEVVLHDDSQKQLDNCDFQFKEAIVKLESSSSVEPPDWRHSLRTKFFYCINCSFRNEVAWSNGIEDTPSFCLPRRNELSTQTSLFRCGYCHQTSNWKHVIERHCRLVHNTPAYIERYSAKDDQFKHFTPTKRRTDFPSETITMLKKKIKDEIGGAENP